MEIIPALYILDGRCVALYKGSFEQKETYAQSPVNIAKFFEKEGAKKLHIVDLNRPERTDTSKASVAPASSGHSNKVAEQHQPAGIIQKITSVVKIPVQLEASFQTIDDLKSAFALGAAKVIIRPFAQNIIPEAIKTFGPEKIIVEIQAKGSGVIGAGKTTDGNPIDVVNFAEQLVPLGVKEIIYHDEHSEGTLIHPNYDEIDRLFLITGPSEADPNKGLKIYASGGISEPRHLKLLQKIGASGAIIGKAFYERVLTLQQARDSLL